MRADSGSAMDGGNILKTEGRTEIKHLDAGNEDYCFRNFVIRERELLY